MVYLVDLPHTTPTSKPTNHKSILTTVPTETKATAQTVSSSKCNGKYCLGSGQQAGKVEKAELAYRSDLDSLPCLRQMLSNLR